MVKVDSYLLLVAFSQGPKVLHFNPQSAQSNRIFDLGL